MTSGYPLVPAFNPALSPNDLVIANPGIWISFIQTLNGPIYYPLYVLLHSILPPFFITLYRSSSLSGFWSFDNGKTFHEYLSSLWLLLKRIFINELLWSFKGFVKFILSFEFVNSIYGFISLRYEFSMMLFSDCWHKIALLSPTLKQNSLFLYSNTPTTVEPLNSVFISLYNNDWLVFEKTL